MHAIYFWLLFVKAAKVFVYDEKFIPPELLEQSDVCENHVFGSEVKLPRYLRMHSSTAEWSEADFFYVPMNIACVYYGNSKANSQEMDEALLVQLDVILDRLLASLPFFAIMGGRRHIFNLFFKGLFPGWRTKLANSIILTSETEVEFEISSEYFPVQNRITGLYPPYDNLRDIVIPPSLRVDQLLFFASRAQSVGITRPWFVSFFGKRWVDVTEGFEIRQRIIDLFQDRKDSIIHAVDTVKDFVSLEEVAQVMGKSKFCLIPRGRSAWTTRFYDAWSAGCVPVVISDYWVLPFNLSSTSLIHWPAEALDESLTVYLESITNDEITVYRTEAEKIRQQYIYGGSAEEQIIAQLYKLN